MWRCSVDDMAHGWAQGSRLCMMCPGNTTNLEDGSGSCPQAVLPGTNMTTRYAVIVSFGVYLNGTSMSDIAQKVTPCHHTVLLTISEEANLWHCLRQLAKPCHMHSCSVGCLSELQRI